MEKSAEKTDNLIESLSPIEIKILPYLNKSYGKYG